jgi:hypothetical protein
MAKVDMKNWYETNEEKLLELKNNYIEAIEVDQDFFTFGDGDNNAIVDHELDFKANKLHALKPVDDLIAELSKVKFIPPKKPDDIDSDSIQRFKEHVFDDSRLDKFESQLKAVYSAFSSPSEFKFNQETMVEAIQSAFYDYQYDRDKESLYNKVDAVAAQWAAAGYFVAPGAMEAQIADEIDNFDKQRVGKTENVFQNLAQVVQENIKQSIENGTQIESLHMDFAIKYSELSKVFITSHIDAYVAEIEKRLAEQKAQMMKIDSLTQGMDLDADADIVKNKLELHERTARLNAYIQATNTYIDMEAGKTVEELKLATNIADGFGGIFSAYGSMFTGISYEE